ncbi:MAG: META domain-containing protein [Phycisphaerales bacterium]|nr:META domain-containing protein [Planctomycetota bacterium]MCH8507324.1 META domain-containing protein [Phycisphaerales bacterium]
MKTPSRTASRAARLGVPAAALLLGACVHNPSPDPNPLPDARPIAEAVRQAQKDWPWIAGTVWELAAIDGRPPIEGVRVWISFKPDETWVTGSTGCNRFTGGYIRRGQNGLRVRSLAVTERFCSAPQGIMQQEARFLHLLGEAIGYHATAEWFHLIDDEDRVILSFSAARGEP